jgi:hypothetical protein
MGQSENIMHNNPRQSRKFGSRNSDTCNVLGNGPMVDTGDADSGGSSAPNVKVDNSGDTHFGDIDIENARSGGDVLFNETCSNGNDHSDGTDYSVNVNSSDEQSDDVHSDDVNSGDGSTSQAKEESGKNSFRQMLLSRPSMSNARWENLPRPLDLTQFRDLAPDARRSALARDANSNTAVAVQG